jgi:hypothetical protein
LETLFAGDAFADSIKPVAAKWLADLNQLGNDVKDKKLEQIAWQKKVEELFAQCNLPDLLKFIDFDKLTNNVKFRDHGELSLRAKFPAVEGLPTNLVFGHQVFALKKDRSVVPHGHVNMATAFLILKGDFHGRHFDRLEDAEQFMIIQPTIDRAFTVGECSTISDYKDNVHWFKATSDTGFIFNIHVNGITAGRSGRVYIDPNGEKLAGGKIKARKVGAEEVIRLYG